MVFKKYTDFRKGVLITNFLEPACKQCTMEKIHFGKMFENTLLQYAPRPLPRGDVLRIADL